MRVCALIAFVFIFAGVGAEEGERRDSLENLENLEKLEKLEYSEKLDSVAQDTLKTDTLKGDTTRMEIVAVKTNLLYWGAATMNAQIEFRLTKHWSLELGVGFNPFPLKDVRQLGAESQEYILPRWRHVMVSVTPRYWICNVYHRDFVSFNAAYAHYNVAGNAYPVAWMYKQVLDYRYQGDAVMAGLSYGWHWAIKPHFSIELEGGIDGGYTWFKKFKCVHCGDMVGKGGRWFLLPKVGLNLSFPLGGNEESLARRCDCEDIGERKEEGERREARGERMDTLVVENPDSLENLEKLDSLENLEIPDSLENPEIPDSLENLENLENIEPVDTVVVENPDSLENLEIPDSLENIEPVVEEMMEPEETEKDIHSAAMQRLRSALLRDESEYEPYDINKPLSADPRNTFVYFPVDVTKLDRNFIENDRLMDSIMFIIGDALRDSLLEITRIQIVGFASFDGRLAYNIGLAESRAKTIKEYIQSLFGLSDDKFAVCNGGESWAELRYHLEKVEFEGRDEVLRIIDTEPDQEMREKKIKALHGGATYRYMRDELKKIMRNLGCITVYCREDSAVSNQPSAVSSQDSEQSDKSEMSETSDNSEHHTKRIVQRDWDKQSVKKVEKK